MCSGIGWISFEVVSAAMQVTVFLYSGFHFECVESPYHEGSSDSVMQPLKSDFNNENNLLFCYCSIGLVGKLPIMFDCLQKLYTWFDLPTE